MIKLTYVKDEDKTGKKGSEYSHWQATATKKETYIDDFDGVGDDPLSAVMDLAANMLDYIDHH